MVLLKKLSNEDKNILKEIYDELEKIYIPTTFQNVGGYGHQVRTGAVSQRGARQTCFGLSFYRGKKRTALYSEKHPHIDILFKKFINSHNPEFDYDSVYVNKNVVCKKHIDHKNAKSSLIVGIGEYSGGETVLELEEGEKEFDIKNQSLIFDGSKIPHYNNEFEGLRYSLVFF